ncbi:Uncharacterised protein [Vibrio cholerae]|uniref:Uncharacterized protein n=1 Tax=Vibrio cholerae TaxID=666 RepID=A0A655ZKI6_VIBCL|nr:Uncharacterised protein [Vibrio cholerae]CSC26879.1 Uncharacterised protein [Vibrio cholerae]CSC40477.1 Uncharacterised protein [Vibrio cholerae]CSC62290.1 Uncharacterised protein [Vibrio cholerae]CSC71306.1 Uncharacterised protein [Vibrio cholerae]
MQLLGKRDNFFGAAIVTIKAIDQLLLRGDDKLKTIIRQLVEQGFLSKQIRRITHGYAQRITTAAYHQRTQTAGMNFRQ